MVLHMDHRRGQDMATPHHRTNFHRAYKPPVTQQHSYVPPPAPSNRSSYTDESSIDEDVVYPRAAYVTKSSSDMLAGSEDAVDARLLPDEEEEPIYEHDDQDNKSIVKMAAYQMTNNMPDHREDVFSTTSSELPFDQANDPGSRAAYEEDEDSQPGMIRPRMVTPPQHRGQMERTPSSKPFDEAASMIRGATSNESSSLYCMAPPRVSMPITEANFATIPPPDEDDIVVQEDDPSALTTDNMSAKSRTPPPLLHPSNPTKKSSEDEDSLFDFESRQVSFGKQEKVAPPRAAAAKKEEATKDDQSYGYRSTYTKSAESEVEDIIKDIFMIGSAKTTKPGRRSIKHRVEEDSDEDQTLDTYDDNGTQDDTQDGTQDDTQDGTHDGSLTNDGTMTNDGTLTNDGTFTDGTQTDDSKSRDFVSSASTRKTKNEEDPIATALNFVGGKLTAVGTAVGAAIALGLEKVHEDHSATSTKKTTREVPTAAAEPERAAEEEGSNWDFFQMASDAIFGPEGAGFCDHKKGPSLEEDVRLVDLAVQAAVSMHRLNGYEFDTSYEIDIAGEIKFCVVDLQLPLGLIFQENEKGCWVTKILPDGSAAKTSSNIQVGDQLAAVDGTSAIDMNVDDIARLIKNKKKAIELTFVRYVGPLRPEAGSYVQEEGYEIHATEAPPPQPAKKRLTWSPPTTPTPQTPEMSPKPSSPKGILKTSRPAEKPSPSTVKSHSSTSSNSEQKRRFRLFGRRKQQQ